MNRKKSKSRRFVAATVANRNQTSKFSKVHWQVALDSEPGTRIREPCQHAKSTGDCVVRRMRKVYSMSLRSMRWSLSGTRSLRARRRSGALRVQCGPVTSLRLAEKANSAMKAEMLGLSGCDCPQARGPSKWGEMHRNPRPSATTAVREKTWFENAGGRRGRG